MEHLCLQAPFQTPPKVLIIIMKLGECTALWGECERVAGCICVSEKIPGEEVKAANVHAGVCREMYSMCEIILVSLYNCWSQI